MDNMDFTLPEGTHTVALGVGDLNGIMRGKRIPSTHWENACKSGTAVSVALFAIDMTCDVWDTPYVNFDNGYPDMHIFPAMKPFALPWEPGVAMALGRGETMEHTTVPIDPRQALAKQVERAKSMGITVKVGTELEFYLLDPETLKPRDEGIQVYSLERAAEMEHVIGPIRQQINECGIPIEQSNPEYAAGQVEVNIRYDEAMIAADRVIMFKTLVKQLAGRHGYIATFMPKPFIEESGNGFHTHYSLWKDGANMFSSGGKLSDDGRMFVGGLQKRMAETAIVGCPNVNGYRRRAPYTFCPINTAWGVDNRTAGIRIIEGSDSAVRVEKRDAGADANPYLLIAAEIAAGLDGIEGRIEPSKPSTGNAYEEEGAEPIPTDIQTALRLASESSWVKETLGEDMLALLTQQGERELGFFANQVTQVEMDRYLRNF